MVRRKELRRRLYHGLLRHVVTIAGSAAREKPELGERFELMSPNASNYCFAADHWPLRVTVWLPRSKNQRAVPVIELPLRFPL